MDTDVQELYKTSTYKIYDKNLVIDLKDSLQEECTNRKGSYHFLSIIHPRFTRAVTSVCQIFSFAILHFRFESIF